MANHSLSEAPFPNVHPELPLMQLLSLSWCPTAGHQKEEISTSSSAAPLEEGADCHEGTPQPPLLQAEQTK